MRTTVRIALVVVTFAVALIAASPPPDPRAGKDKEMNALAATLRPLHAPLATPKPGEWLYHHKESGQTFKQYTVSTPVMPTPDRRKIYIQPLGDFTPRQRAVIDQTCDFIARFYGLPVTTQPAMPMSVIPAWAQRVHPTLGGKQVLTTYVLNTVLKPRVPKDGFALIALTASDLWPGEGWNFVFGQASLTDRVGVWSIHRFGNPADGDEPYRQCLRRTAAVAVHELGHQFSIEHCTAYSCVMCGSNSLPEADRQPIEACPECLAKICWATGAEPKARFRALLEFVRTAGLKADAAIYEKSLAALGEPTTQPGK